MICDAQLDIFIREFIFTKISLEIGCGIRESLNVDIRSYGGGKEKNDNGRN